MAVSFWHISISRYAFAASFSRSRNRSCCLRSGALAPFERDVDRVCGGMVRAGGIQPTLPAELCRWRWRHLAPGLDRGTQAMAEAAEPTGTLCARGLDCVFPLGYFLQHPETFPRAQPDHHFQRGNDWRSIGFAVPARA